MGHNDFVKFDLKLKAMLKIVPFKKWICNV